ncbi:recombinase family protein, partial [Spirosoma migulaei]
KKNKQTKESTGALIVPINSEAIENTETNNEGDQPLFLDRAEYGKYLKDEFDKLINALEHSSVSESQPENLSTTSKKAELISELPPLQLRSISEVSINSEAQHQAQLLSKRYDVPVKILRTDSEYYSDNILLGTIQDKIYYISEESPIDTSRTTEVLIREYKLRVGLMHTSRIEKTTQNAVALADKIQDIRNDYTLSHNGKEPSLGEIARSLNRNNIPSPRGNSSWRAETVKRVLNRTKNDNQLG